MMGVNRLNRMMMDAHNSSSGNGWLIHLKQKEYKYEKCRCYNDVRQKVKKDSE